MDNESFYEWKPGQYIITTEAMAEHLAEKDARIAALEAEVKDAEARFTAMLGVESALRAQLAEERRVRGMLVEGVEFFKKSLPDPYFTLPKFHFHGTEYQDIRAWVDAALAAAAKLEAP